MDFFKEISIEVMSISALMSVWLIWRTIGFSIKEGLNRRNKNK
jgi:hypothetical protein